MADSNTDETDGMDAWAEAMAEQGEAESSAQAVKMDTFDTRTNQEGKENPINLEVLMDVPVAISMEIGRTSINIRSLLQLNQGSIVELDRLAGEPLDVLVNGTLIARGEVVVVNEKFGIRLTDVISPAERLKKLR